MKKFVLVLVVLGVVATIGYLLGTEGGRGRRDELLARVRKSTNGGRAPDIDLAGVVSEAADSEAAVKEEASDAIDARS